MEREKYEKNRSFIGFDGNVYVRCFAATGKIVTTNYVDGAMNAAVTSAVTFGLDS